MLGWRVSTSVFGRRTSAVCVSSAVLLVAVASGIARAGESLPGLATETAQLGIRPASFPYSGDRSAYLGGSDGTGRAHDFGHLRWTSWTTKVATATGVAWLYVCRASCRFTGYPASVRAFRPASGHFTRLTVVYRYQGLTVTDTRRVERSGGRWLYFEISTLAH